MKRYDLYVYLRSFTLLLLLTAALISINWVNLAVKAIDGLLSGGHSAWSVAEYVLLLAPISMSNAIPLSVFFGLTYLFFRMNSDWEIIALKGAGMSPARMARPFLVVGLLAAVLTSMLEHIIVPRSKMRAVEINSSIEHDLSSFRITTGKFLFPMDGVAVFVGNLSQQKELQNVFIHDARDRNRERTYLSRQARLDRGSLDPVLEMSAGRVEEWRFGEKDLDTLLFETLRFNLSKFDNQREPVSHGLRIRSSLDLAGEVLNGSATDQQNLHLNVVEIHNRLVKSLRSLFYPLIGVSMLLAAEAFRLPRHFAFVPAILTVVILHVFSDYLDDLVRYSEATTALVHLPHLIASLLVVILLVWSRKPNIRVMRLLSHSRYTR